MGEEAHHEVQLQVLGLSQLTKLLLSDQVSKQPSPRVPKKSAAKAEAKSYWWWIRISAYITFILTGQAVATLLGRQYFVKGGNSKWLATLVQLCAFPLMIPFYLVISRGRNPAATTTGIIPTEQASISTRTIIYLTIGLIGAGDCYLYSVGLQYLPVSTYTLICASQLGFNAFFSFFLNSQKFTPFIINSLVILTISSVLLVFNNESSDPQSVSKVKYAIGFVCTVGASAGYGLVLSLTQLCFKKYLKRRTYRTVVDMIFYQQVVATSAVVVVIFASGEWKSYTKEMDEYQLGSFSYIMNLLWTAISWQFFGIGSVGLIFEVSSLFANAISALGLPIVPVLAVFAFQDKMSGIKAISMVLAIWGFISYLYQQYLDDPSSKDEDTNAIEASCSPKGSSTET